MKKSPLFSIFLIVLVDVLGLTIILPLLPFYAESLGATPVVVGMLVSAYAACQLIAGPPLGHLSDRVGRRPVLLVSQMGTFAGFLMLASARALWMVFLARIIDGVHTSNHLRMGSWGRCCGSSLRSHSHSAHSSQDSLCLPKGVSLITAPLLGPKKSATSSHSQA